MSNNENPHPNIRNNQQNQQDGIISFGANVSHSNIQNLTNIENLENLNITHQHEHQHDHHHQHQHHHIEQHQHEHFHQHRNEQHQHLYVSQTVNISNIITPTIQNTRTFDEPKFSEYFRKTECTYSDIFRKGRPITNDMYINTPILLKSTFDELKTKRTNQDTREGTTKISEAFPIISEDGSANRLVAVTGEAGAGKTVLLKTLQSYYINKGFFAFLLDFSKLALLKDSMPFSGILKNSCSNFLFDDSNTFDVWLNENEKRCLLLLDGLDMAPFLVKENVPAVNITSFATVTTWVSLLLSGDIMKGSKIIFSSRQSSVHQLSISKRPDILYTMNGFSDESVGRVIGNYNNEHKDEIVNFVKNKGSNVVNYARNPFVLSMISLIYKNSLPSISSETTMTELYTLAFKHLRCSTHNRSDSRKDVKTEKLVDQFFYQTFTEGKITFTEEDVLKHDGLTMELLENFSWVNIGSISASDLIEPNEKIISLVHQSLMEYHVSRHLMRTMAVNEFKNIVQTQMYKLEEQDRWSMIRRFTSGLVNTGEFDKRKSEIHLKQFVNELKDSTSENVCEKDAQITRELNQAALLQANLYNDLLEMGKQLNFIKKSFSGISDVHFQVLMKDATSIEGPIFFLKNVDPHLNDLTILFSDNLERTQCIRLATAVENLSKKIQSTHIRDISPFEGHVKELCRIFNKNDSLLALTYNEHVEDDEIEVIKYQLQNHIDHMDETKAIIQLVHRYRQHLIRHPSYTTMTSSILKPSHFGAKTLTIKLNAIESNQILQQVGTMARFCRWGFIISYEKEVRNLIEVLMRLKPIDVLIVMIVIPHDINWNYIRMLCKTISKMEHKVRQISLHNLIKFEIGCVEISLLIPKVEIDLYLTYSHDINELALVLWTSKLQDLVQFMSPNMDLRIEFGNWTIVRLPHTQYVDVMRMDTERPNENMK